MPGHHREEDERTGGDSVADVFERAGVRVVFGIPSVHNLPIYDALARRGSIRPITVRHEQGAAGAADAYARVTGEIGVCITSTGPGAANAMGGLLEAFTSGSPVLHLTGQVESRVLGQGRGFIHEVPDQAAMLGALSKKVLRARTVDEIAPLLAECVATALEHPRGPVSLELPIDLQYEEARSADLRELERLLSPAPSPSPDRVIIARSAELLRAARRPLVWAGGGVVASGAEHELQAVARALSAGVLTSPNGRGVLDERDPLCVGNLSWEPSVRQLCREADVLLAVGTRFQGPNTENWKMELPETLVQIDVDPDRPGRSYPAAVAVKGDAKKCLSLLLAELGTSATEASWPARVLEATRAGRARLRSSLGPQAALLDATGRVLGARAIVVKDSTIPAYTWGNRLLPVAGTRTSVMPNGFAIGLGLPHALGAAAAEAVSGGNRPVLLMVGDGGIMLALPELATFVEEGLSVVAVCFADGGYGILRNIQQRQYGRTLGVELGRPDLAAVARALGAHGESVASVEEYEGALEKAVGRNGPTLVEVDLGAIGPMERAYTGTSRPPRREAGR